MALVSEQGPQRGTALFAWVKQALLADIARGDVRPDEPFVTQKQIVERFGVSTTTAVRALNELVADGVVERRRGLGTFVTASPAPPAAPAALAPAVRPAPGEARTLAYVRPDDGGSHGAQLLSGLATGASDAGCRLTVAHTRGPGDEEEHLRAAVAAGAHALVFFPHDHSTAGPLVEALGRSGMPVVLLDRYYPDVPTDAVLFDDFAVGHALTTALVERGHTAMAVLWSEIDVTSVRDRLSGHYRALREAGLAEVPDRSALRQYTGLPPAARRARLRRLFDAHEPPTALVCGNAITLSVLTGDLLALEGGVPAGLELASMDEAGPTDVSPLAAASARLPGREMGRTAVALAVERLDAAARTGGSGGADGFDADAPDGAPGAPTAGADVLHRHVVLSAEVHLAPERRVTLALGGAAPVAVGG